MINKNKLVFDPADVSNSDFVGSYVLSSDGTKITSTNVSGKDGLDVNVINASLVVTATDLDIRNLSAAQDNVAISDGVDTLAINADGSINVQATFDYAEDSVASSGDVGAYVLSVRQDTLASSTSASGDYQSFKTDALGRLWMNDTHQTMVFAAVSVLVTATDLVASDLANRKRILLQNLGTKKIYIGDASVTTANGIELFSGASMELDIGPGINLYAISSSGTQDVRVMELA